MLVKDFVLTNPGGLHARPATVFVQLCKAFQSDIHVSLAGRQADAKSIISLMTLGAGQGKSVTISIEGVDEQHAMDKIAEYFST